MKVFVYEAPHTIRLASEVRGAAREVNNTDIFLVANLGGVVEDYGCVAFCERHYAVTYHLHIG